MPLDLYGICLPKHFQKNYHPIKFGMNHTEPYSLNCDVEFNQQIHTNINTAIQNVNCLQTTQIWALSHEALHL